MAKLGSNQLARRMNRRAILLVGGCLSLAVLQVSLAQDSKSSSGADSGAKIHREGARIEQQPVSFKTENDRLLLTVGNDPKPLIVLENLASQRIFRATREDPDDCRWTVTGSYTEFEGKNFFLIERAVRLYQKKK